MMVDDSWALRLCLQFHFTGIRILLHWLTESKYTKYSQELCEDLCLLSFSADSFPEKHLMGVISVSVIGISVILAVAVTLWKTRWAIHSDHNDSNMREMLSGVRLLFFPLTRLKNKISRPEPIIWFAASSRCEVSDICNQSMNVSLVFFFNLYNKIKSLYLYGHEESSNSTQCFWFWEEEKVRKFGENRLDA